MTLTDRLQFCTKMDKTSIDKTSKSLFDEFTFYSLYHRSASQNHQLNFTKALLTTMQYIFLDTSSYQRTHQQQLKHNLQITDQNLNKSVLHYGHSNERQFI